jgi:hypothetical protein
MKKFIIIGPQNALTYKEIFPLIKSNQIWWGFQCVRWFKTENATPKSKIVDGITLTEGDRSRWWTNIEIDKRNIHLDLYKHYSNEYKHYDNYDAIEVSETADIPMDYDGVMGVPITFFDKYNPNQFEIVGMGEDNGTGYSGGVWLGGSKSCLVNGKAAFKRIFIKRK